MPLTIHNPNVLDEYGNNAAINCPSCSGVFVFSRHLNKSSGRECPHCHKSKVTISDGDLKIEVTQ
jgi:Zn finger protein HypA/HybF involved in hydrogenase expression